jgi:hypothetical protein
MSGGGWLVRVQYWTQRERARWLDFGPMPYSRAAGEGRRHVLDGRNARLVDPDGKEGPLIRVSPDSAGNPRKRETLQLNLFSRE